MNIIKSVTYVLNPGQDVAMTGYQLVYATGTYALPEETSDFWKMKIFTLTFFSGYGDSLKDSGYIISKFSRELYSNTGKIEIFFLGSTVKKIDVPIRYL